MSPLVQNQNVKTPMFLLILPTTVVARVWGSCWLHISGHVTTNPDPSSSKFLSVFFFQNSGPISLSITTENAAKPAHPKHMAAGPDLYASAAPVAQPAVTEFVKSCFALSRSM
jgi:hypothetical protein